MSAHELAPAIAVLERKVDEAERKANELRSALNVLRGEAGLPPRGPGGGGSNDHPTVNTQIRPDTFFGQKQQTAIRSYLEMRKAQGLGPAKPREIYDALLSGGFQYDAKDAEVALVGLRALLRKRSAIFVKLPNGTYGLASWYPDLKRQKVAAAVADEDQDSDVDADDDSDVAESETASDKESDAA